MEDKNGMTLSQQRKYTLSRITRIGQSLYPVGKRRVALCENYAPWSVPFEWLFHNRGTVSVNDRVSRPIMRDDSASRCPLDNEHVLRTLSYLGSHHRHVASRCFACNIYSKLFVVCCKDSLVSLLHDAISASSAFVATVAQLTMRIVRLLELLL